MIREIEPTARGVYCGAIGYFGPNGESHFNIAIRTMTLTGGHAHFHVGGGIREVRLSEQTQPGAHRLRCRLPR